MAIIPINIEDEECIHNNCCTYTDGFYCEGCSTFFSKDSVTYRSGRLLSDLWMVLNNINVDLTRLGQKKDKEVSALKNEIGIGINHANYEDIISRAEEVISGYGKTSDSCKITMSK